MDEEELAEILQFRESLHLGDSIEGQIEEVEVGEGVEAFDLLNLRGKYEETRTAPGCRRGRAL